MKKFTRFWGLFLCLSLLIALPVSAVNAPMNRGLVVSEAESVMNQCVEPLLTEAELRNVYWSSSEFQAHYADDPADALATLDSIVDAYFASPQAETYTPSSVATVDSDVASVDVTLVKQINSYSCGPASAYMAIDGWGGTGDITGSNTTAKLKTLASEMGTNSSDGTYVYKLRNGLNNYVSRYEYQYMEGSTISELNFRVYTYNSLTYNRAPILHAKTAALSYYNGHNTGHYITVTEFDYGPMEVRLHDPNNNSTYYGVHYVPYEEALSSIADYSGRYYICYWP